VKLPQKIRPLAIAIVQNAKKQILLDKSFDQIKKETFFRPMGGGIDFGELGKDAVKREFFEEIGRKIEVLDFLGTFENIFEFEMQAGHEIVLLYHAKFSNPSDEKFEALDIVEDGRPVSKAVWTTLDQIREQKIPLYPNGLLDYLQNRGF
jgi:ADP-ribose pyrophosphatase YjhB (NUDIX family)